MIVTVHLTNSFLDKLCTLNFNESEKIFLFIKELLEDKSIFFVGDKDFINELNKKYHKKNNFEKNLIFLSYIKQKSSWIDINIQNYKEVFKKKNLPIDLNLDKDFFVDKIDNYKKKINSVKFKFLKLHLLKGSLFYIYKEDELNSFKQNLLKATIVSDKIILWDQYIPDNLARINKFTKRIEKHLYFNDYCNTLKFLDNEIFSKINKKYFCEILTMNKLENDWNFKKSQNLFENIVSEYIKKIKNVKGVIHVKSMDDDNWDIKHSRLMLFKDHDNQLLAYCVVEQGMDFIKREKKNYYGKKFKKRIYTFTPGNVVNFDETLKDITQITNIYGKPFSNFA